MHWVFISTIILFNCALWSRPSGADVKNGVVSFQPIEAGLEVHASDRAIIHWEDFSIQKEEIMRFIQPNASSTVLNRVIGFTSSMIHGTLEANGRIILINPNGVLIGKTGVIKTAEFIASTCDILDLNDWSIKRDGKECGFEALDASVVINHQGMIEATGVDRSEGRILLLSPLVEIEGCLAASKSVELLGDQIELKSSSHIEVNGGVVLVGGDFQGSNSEVLNSQIVKMHPGAVINASCRDKGNGGRVILWSNQSTDFQGEIFCRGGPAGGDGGLIEISSKGTGYHYHGKVHTASLKGKSGEVFLDPCDIVINAGPSAPPFTFPTYAPAVNAMVSSADIQAALTGGNNVTIKTSAGVGGTGKIDWLAGFPVTWLANNTTLTLQAEDTITIGSTITSAGALSDITLATTGGNVIFSTGIAAPCGLSCNGSGSITVSAGGNIEVSGGALLGGAARIVTTTGGVDLSSTGGSILIGNSGSADESTVESMSGTISLQAPLTVEVFGSNILGAGDGTLLTDSGAINLTSLGLIKIGNTTQVEPASIKTATGTINLSGGAGIDLTAGAAITGVAEVLTTNGTGVINATVTGLGDLNISSTTGPSAIARLGDNVAGCGAVNIQVVRGDVNLNCDNLQTVAKIGSQNLVTIQAGNMNMVCQGQGSSCLVDVAKAGPSSVSTIHLAGSFFATAIGGGLNTPKYQLSFQNSTLQFVCGGDLTLLNNATPFMSGFFPLTGAGTTSFNVGGNALVSSSGPNGCVTRIDSTSPMAMAIGGNLTVEDFLQGTATVDSRDNFDLNVGGDVLVQATSAVTSTAILGVSSPLNRAFHATVKGSVNLGNKGQIILADDGEGRIIANKNITLGSNATVTAQNPPGPNAKLILVVDNQDPVSPLIGNGAFIMDTTATIYPVGAPPVQIFTARRSQNSILGLINSANFVPGPFDVDTVEERWSVYFPQAFVGSPFTIFYKEPQVPAVPPPAPFQKLATVLGNMFDTLSEFETPLSYYQEEFCVAYLLGSRSHWLNYSFQRHCSQLPNNNCYPVQVLNYRKEPGNHVNFTVLEAEERPLFQR